MATALTAPSSSSNNKHWWPRISSNKESYPYGSTSHLYSGGNPSIGGRPHTASGAGRPTLMTSVTNPKSTSSNAFTSSKPSSRFNLASVIGFGSKSKKQQPVDIQDPPSQVRSLPTPKTNTYRQFGVTPQPTLSSNPRLSRGVASSTSGTSRASTDGPLTPADDLAPGARISYQHSLMTLTDLSDPFATNSPLSDRRSSAHSEKSISRRLMHKVEGKPTKTTVRLPVGEGPKRKNSRDRSATLPSRVRTANDASEVYQPLRAVEPPWTTSTSPEAPSFAPVTSNRPTVDESSNTVRGSPSGTTMPRNAKNTKLGLPWPDVRSQAIGGQGLSQVHQRTHSSSSISKEYHPDGSRPSIFRASTSSSTRTSVSSSMYTSPLSVTGSPPFGSKSPADVLPRRPSTSAQTTPTITTQFARASTSPRPPPTTGLPPTPTQSPGFPSHSHLQPSSPVGDQHPLRTRSGTAASASALSFASSLSSLSFTSRPSPQDPPTRGAYDYPSLMHETLPVPGPDADDAIERRGSNSGSSSASNKDSKGSHGGAKGPVQQPAIRSPWSELTPKSPKATLPGSRPLPSPPVAQPSPGISPGILPTYKRERALSAASSTFSITSDAGRTLRKQRSFHNTSIQAPAPLQPTLRHYNSFDPSAPPGIGGQMRSPPLPPPRDLPPPPPPLTPSASSGKRSSTGKDSLTSPRRKLFSSHKHDRERERERKQDPELVDTSAPASATSGGHPQTLHHSSSWFDDGAAGPEPASASSASTSTAHDVAQHIVPPAELLRLGAAWERENESLNGLRRAKSSWGSRDSDGLRSSYGSSSSSSKLPMPRSAGNGASSTPTQGLKLPRSASLLSKASSAPSFGRPRGSPELSYVPATSSPPQETYTSLSPPPRRPQRAVSRLPLQTSSGLPPPPPRRTLSNATAPSGSTPPKGALIERKPSFLDMSTRQSVSLDVPELEDRDEPERDSFLELTRGMDSIDTIRESRDSVDSFMQ